MSGSCRETSTPGMRGFGATFPFRVVGYPPADSWRSIWGEEWQVFCLLQLTPIDTSLREKVVPAILQRPVGRSLPLPG